MRNKDFDKLLKEAIILDAEEQGARIEPCSEPIPEAAQARFDAALNGTRRKSKKTIADASSEQPQPVKRAHRWLAYGLTAVSAAAVILVVVLLIGTGGLRGTKPQEPVMPAEQQPMQAETTMEPLPEPGGSSFGPAFILNGKELDVYTEHYFIAGTDDDIPLNAFLSSIGSYYVDSPYNKYQVQCYEIEGIRYIYDWESQVFALAEQYDSVVQAAKTKGRMPTEAEFQAIDLLPAGVEMQAEAWLDHSTLESVLRKMGLDITIELDREENAIRVTMSEPEPAETTMEPLPEPVEQEPEPVEIRAEDLIGTWTMWEPDNVDTDYRLTIRGDGTAKMVYQIPLSGEQTIEGTYSVKNGITVTFGDETMQAVYDPESDALLLFESETSWLTLYRNPDTYMIEHWFEMQRKPLSKKTVAMEDLFGVWTLERAESAFSSFDLSGLSGYLSIEQGSFRIGMRLAGEDYSASLACSVIDSVLTETGTYYGVRAIVDPDTGLLKLSLVFFDRELTAADLVLVFRKLSNAEQTMTQDALVGTWRLKAMESEDNSLSGQIAIINALIAAGKYEATYTFLSDGNGISYWDIQGEKTAQAFTYVIDGDKLIVSGETMIFTIKGDQLSLTEEGLTLLWERDTSTEEAEEHSKLQLKTQTWQGYTCLFPETFEVQAATDQKISATEEALLKLDMAALQTVGLTDMDYYLVAESMLNGQDLLTWYLAADGWDDKPEDFDTAESVEIAPGIVSEHYYNRNYDSYICITKLNTIGTNTLFLAASSMTKTGTADFDGIAKEFLAKNGDFAPSETGILNGKYGKSKVFAGDGYQITLTEQFSEQKSEMGFDGYYTSYFGAVMIKIEPFTLKDGLENETVTEYIANVIKNNRTDAKPEEKDGLVFYRYKREGMCGWNFAFKGEKAFYLVQFLCREADESELEELFFSIAKTIKVEGSERWNA